MRSDQKVILCNLREKVSTMSCQFDPCKALVVFLNLKEVSAICKKILQTFLNKNIIFFIVTREAKEQIILFLTKHKLKVY